MAGHGSTTRYNQGCHCEACKQANREHVAAWRAKQQPKPALKPKPALDPRPREAVPKVRRPDPEAVYRPTPAMSMSDFAAARGYDPVTRTYAA